MHGFRLLISCDTGIYAIMFGKSPTRRRLRPGMTIAVDLDIKIAKTYTCNKLAHHQFSMGIPYPFILLMLTIASILKCTKLTK